MTQPSNLSRNFVTLCFLAWLSCAIGGSLLSFTGCTPSSEESVVALVNGRQITQNKLEASWEELSEVTRSQYEKEGGKRRFLDELITRELLLQEARKQGIDQNDAIRDQTQRYREQLILDELLRSLVKTKIELSDEELDALYAKHAHELLPSLKVHVSQMLLPSLYAAKDIEARINRGEDFAKLAQRYSLDNTTKSKGGDLGPYRKNLVLPEVDAVLQALTPRTVSAPIKTEAGYYLVIVTALDEEMIQADLVIRDRLRQELLNEQHRKRFDDALVDIRAKATVRLDTTSRYIVDVIGTP